MPDLDLDLVAQAGMNLVRCPIHWSMFYEYQTNASVALTNVPWKADVVIFKHIDWLVNACSNRRRSREVSRFPFAFCTITFCRFANTGDVSRYNGGFDPLAGTTISTCSAFTNRAMLA